jgi:hypothetical protein
LPCAEPPFGEALEVAPAGFSLTGIAAAQRDLPGGPLPAPDAHREAAGLLPLLLSAGETDREILYPVVTVVIGGLLTSTLFEFLLRPALFILDLWRNRARSQARA